MPRKLAIIEIETGEDERLCSDKCAFIAFGNHCGLFEERLGSDGKERPVRCPQCLESTRLASLDRAVAEAAIRYSESPSGKLGDSAEADLFTAVDQVRNK